MQSLFVLKWMNSWSQSFMNFRIHRLENKNGNHPQENKEAWTLKRSHAALKDPNHNGEICGPSEAKKCLGVDVNQSASTMSSLSSTSSQSDPSTSWNWSHFHSSWFSKYKIHFCYSGISASFLTAHFGLLSPFPMIGRYLEGCKNILHENGVVLDWNGEDTNLISESGRA